MDLRVLDLLSSPTGGRIAAPEFDPFYSTPAATGTSGSAMTPRSPGICSKPATDLISIP